MIICSKCQKLFNNKEDVKEIFISNETAFYWCTVCVSKHLNSSEVNN